jgi:hypothetical protein
VPEQARASQSNRQIAVRLRDVVGPDPRVTRHRDDDGRSSVDIVQFSDAPDDGLNTYSTIGLSDTPLMSGGREFPARVELLLVASGTFSPASRVLGSAAFCVINSRWFCEPGAIFSDIISRYETGLEVKHLLFVPPFPWGEELNMLRLPDKSVAWLLAVPITDQERQFAAERSADALEDLFAEHELDYFDFHRQSLV